MEKILEEHVLGGKPKIEWTARFDEGESNNSWASKSVSCWPIAVFINPENIDDYLAR